MQILLFRFMAFNFNNGLEFTCELLIAHLTRRVCFCLVCQLSPEANLCSSRLSLGKRVWFEGWLPVPHDFSYVFEFIRVKPSVVLSFGFLVFVPTQTDKKFFLWFVNFSVYWENWVSFVDRPPNIRSVFIVLFRLTTLLEQIALGQFCSLCLVHQQFFFSFWIENSFGLIQSLDWTGKPVRCCWTSPRTSFLQNWIYNHLVKPCIWALDCVLLLLSNTVLLSILFVIVTWKKWCISVNINAFVGYVFLCRVFYLLRKFLSKLLVYSAFLELNSFFFNLIHRNLNSFLHCID